ncbi:MAG: hypothetical protein R2780_10720 [Crocinitomicaceae bacterium]
MNRKIRLIWDFHGADSKGTAEHHVRHLLEFMQRENLEVLRTGIFSNADFHCMATMTVNEKDVRLLRDTLRPHRAVVVE